ncbi:MAG: hypothetical protein QM831_33155 [Kofleriaceae bacterium]
MNLAQQIEAAFDYRGFITVAKKDGSKVVGFMYDRTPKQVELYDDKAVNRIVIPVADIDTVELTGEDTAAKATKIWERRIGGLEPPDTSAYGEWDAQRGALAIVAMHAELDVVAKAIGARPHRTRALGKLANTTVAAVSIGIGGDPAKAIAAEKPRLVIGAGYAGGLESSLRTGEIVIVSAVRDGATVLHADPKLVTAAHRAIPEALVGEVVNSSRVATTREAKLLLRRDAPNAVAVDLETFAIARAAQATPWIAIRVIVDPANLDLPDFTTHASEHFVVPAIKHALGGAKNTLQLIDLAKRARLANKALAHAFARLGSVVIA